jgi:hypothetical protein
MGLEISCSASDRTAIFRWPAIGTASRQFRNPCKSFR